ncbi:hypothetical protein [Parasedimentitalea huanghaiensis]|uniref:Uncharacterized protein n=1 Tax=Parasedimentitalea huanghaiensis TaxID=2682100 RepID=A0A6L6WDH8_9RHOB|nr:hypothetical protein [Zongyanglinia huanghaiensis]MVO15846.1 hypothetical protein [Zongyanglinia huanghaiensis]
MRFRGLIQDAFQHNDKKGLVLTLNHVEGVPQVDMTVHIARQKTQILDIGRNSTDGQPVSTRACLTGKPVPAYGSILVDWAPANPDFRALRSQWVEEAKTG